MTSGDQKQKVSQFSIFSVFGWLIGGMSFLNLIQDMAPLKLYGLIRDWADAYRLFVHRVTSFLFSWINWRWMTVSEVEGHVLVLSIVLTSAAGRAYAKHRAQRDPTISFLDSIWLYFIVLFPILALVIVLLGWLGFLGGALLLFFWSWLWLTQIDGADRERRPYLPTSKAIRQELFGVLAVVALLVVLNFTVFRPT